MSSSSSPTAGRKRRRREAEPEPPPLMGPPAAAAKGGYDHHGPHGGGGDEEPAATRSTSPATASAEQNGAFAVHWKTTTTSATTVTAEIEVTAPDGASFCLEGRGTIENLSSRDDRSVEILGAALPPSKTARDKQRNEDDDGDGGDGDDSDDSETENGESSSGDNTTTTTKIDFDSPPWTSWVTLHLKRGDRVRISSAGSSSHCCSFAIREAHDAGARPTVVPPSWKAAADRILEDYHHHHHRSTRQQQQQQRQQQQQQQQLQQRREKDDDNDESRRQRPPHEVAPDDGEPDPAVEAAAQQQHLLSAASYFDPEGIVGAGDGGDDDDNDDASSNRDNDPADDSDDNSSANDGFAIVVCGAKGVGKSTCVRYCLNRLLSSGGGGCSAVAVLDADPGQPEFAAPGVLQLTVADRPTLQSPHRRLLLQPQSNNCRTVQSHYLGSVTSQADPALYVRCVASLAAAYRRLLLKDDNDNSSVTMPLLVNLDGWVQGLGFQILATLLQETLRPRHVIQIAGDSVSKSLDVSSVVVASTSSLEHCRLHQCWAYNSERRGELPAAKKKNAAAAECNTTNGVPDDGNAKTEKTSGNLQVSSSQSVALTRTSSLASYDNAEDVPSGDDDDEAAAAGAAAARQHSPTSQNGVSVLPAAPSLPASVFRQVRLVSYFVQSSVTELDDDGTLASLWDRCGAAFHGVDDPDCEIAHALAAARPYAIPLDAVQIQFASPSSSLHGDIRSPHALLDLLNASIVGLCQEAKRPQQQQQQQQQHGESDGANTAPAALLPCVGLGLVRAVDPVRRTLYILTPCPPAALASVRVLTIGSHVELPLACCFRGVHSEAFPHQSFMGAATSSNNNNSNDLGLLGAEPMKSRNNIGRRSLR